MKVWNTYWNLLKVKMIPVRMLSSRNVRAEAILMKKLLSIHDLVRTTHLKYLSTSAKFKKQKVRILSANVSAKMHFHFLNFRLQRSGTRVLSFNVLCVTTKEIPKVNWNPTLWLLTKWNHTGFYLIKYVQGLMVHFYFVFVIFTAAHIVRKASQTLNYWTLT